MSNKKVLTREDVLAIYERCWEEESQAVIARDFAVSQATVSGIKLGLHWNEITGAKRKRPLTPRQQRVLRIYKACSEGNLSRREIAAQEGVSVSLVSQVSLGTVGAKFTKHLQGAK